MKILHVFKVYLPDIAGGIPTVIRDLCAGLMERCLSMVLTTRRIGTPVNVHIDGIHVRRTFSFGDVMSMPIAPLFPFWFLGLARKFDVIAYHAPFPLIDAIVSVWFPRRAALVVHWHSEIVAQRKVLPLVAPFIKRCLGRADRVIVSSQQIIDTSDFLRPIADKCEIIPYGTNLAIWSDLADGEAAQVAALRAQYPRLIVALGRLVPYKGFDVLIAAMAAVDGVCMIIGDGPVHAALAAEISQRGLDQRVLLRGRLPTQDIRCLLHASGLFVLPSITPNETFGIAQIEAMACGCAVVNTNLPTSVPSVARHNQEGLTVTPGDVGELAEAISTLLNDAPLRARFGVAAKARAMMEYDQTVSSARTLGVYQRVVENRRKN
jgi:rhamnosyl/mannosyltransferase